MELACFLSKALCSSKERKKILGVKCMRMGFGRSSSHPKSLLELVSRIVLEEWSFEGAGPHRAKWTLSRV